MPEKPSKTTQTFLSSDMVPLRAPQRWFKCIDYTNGLRIELPFGDEATAIEAGIAHIHAGASGTVKVGYYGFRSRIIVYAVEELRDLGAK